MKIRPDKEMDYNGIIKKEVNVNIEIRLCESDIVTWLNNCENADVLKRIAAIARSYAKAIESPDNDDFRSRA